MGPAPSSGRKNKTKQKNKRASQGRRATESEAAEEEPSRQILGSGSSEEAAVDPAQEPSAFPDEDLSLSSLRLTESQSAVKRQSTKEKPSKPEAGTPQSSNSSRGRAPATSSSPETSVAKTNSHSASRQYIPPALRGPGPQQTAEATRRAPDAGQETLLSRQPSGHIKTGRPSSASSRRVEAGNTQPISTGQLSPSASAGPAPAVDQAVSHVAPLPASSSHRVAPKPLSRLRRAEIMTTPKVMDPLAAAMPRLQDTQVLLRQPDATLPLTAATSAPVYIPVAGNLEGGAKIAPYESTGMHLQHVNSQKFYMLSSLTV